MCSVSFVIRMNSWHTGHGHNARCNCTENKEEKRQILTNTTWEPSEHSWVSFTHSVTAHRLQQWPEQLEHCWVHAGHADRSHCAQGCLDPETLWHTQHAVGAAEEPENRDYKRTQVRALHVTCVKYLINIENTRKIITIYLEQSLPSVISHLCQWAFVLLKVSDVLVLRIQRTDQTSGHLTLSAPHLPSRFDSSLLWSHWTADFWSFLKKEELTCSELTVYKILLVLHTEIHHDWILINCI